MKQLLQREENHPLFRASLSFLGLMLFFLPLLFSTRTYDNFALHKAVFFHVALSFIVVSLVFYSLQNRSENGYKIYEDILFLPLIFLFCAVTLSVLRSQNLFLSLLGNYQRFDGFWHFLNLLVFYFSVRYIFVSAPPSAYIPLSVILPSFCVSLYALCQHFGLDWFSWESLDRRSISTFGHANALAAYLAMVFPFVFSEYLNPVVFPKKLVSRMFSGIFCIALFSACLLTFSRAGLLSFIAGIVFVLAAMGKRDRLKKYWLKVFVLFVFFACSAFYFQYEAKTKILPVTLGERYLSSINLHESTVRERFLIWESCVKIVRDFPWSGTGYEALVSVFPAYKSAALAENGQSELADKAHNEYLNMSATTGFFGLFAYLWLVLSILMVMFRALKKNALMNDNAFLNYCAYGSALTVYLVNIFFGFSSIVTHVYFFLIAAYFSASVHTGEANHNQAGISAVYKNKPVKIIFAAMFISFVVFNVRLNVSIWLADLNFKKAAARASVNPSASLSYLQKSVSLNPLEDAYRLELARVFGLLYADKKNPVHFQKAVHAYKEILGHHGNDVMALSGLGNLYAARGSLQSKNSDLQLAADYFLSAHRLYPVYPVYLVKAGELFFELSRREDKRKNLVAAFSYAENALQLDPRNFEALFLMAKIYYGEGKLADAQKLLHAAAALSPEKSYLYVWLGNIYAEMGQFKEAISYYNKALKTNPGFPAGIYYEMAKAAMNMGQLQQAETFVRKALVLQKYYPPARELLQRIQKRNL